MNKVQSISDIAEALNLSVSTVSRALSGKGRISPETRRKVYKYAESNSFALNSIAQSLVTAKTYNIAFLMANAPSDEHVMFFYQCLAGVCRKANALSYDVLVVNSDKRDEEELQRLISKRKVDGVIINRELNDAVMSVLEQYHVPSILLGTYDDSTINHVDTDIVKSGFDLVSLLIKNGVKTLAYMGENDCYAVNKRRLKGFLNACDHHVITEKHVYTTQSMASQDQIDQAVQSAIEKCECIITNDDIMCMRVMNSLRRLNVTVPDQIKIATLYHDYLLDLYTPRITGINHNPQRIGENAVKILINILEDNEYPQKGNKLWIEHELLMRESTG